MKKSMMAALTCTAALLLTGCAGKDFVRPADGELITGKSTQADVSRRLGEPYQKGEITKNEKQLKVARYAYANTGGEATYPGVTPARAMAFTFHNDVVASQEFVSSFKSDSSEFDETKVASIIKGKTTRSEVMALLGKPAGDGVYPMIKDPKDKALLYSYSHVTGSVFNMKFYSKVLIVSFSEADIVTDVDYTSTGQK